MSRVSLLDEHIIRILEQVERGELTVLAPSATFNTLLTLQNHVLISLVGENWMLTSRGLDLLDEWRAQRSG